MRKEKAQFSKLWIILTFIAIIIAFASAGIIEYNMGQEAVEAGLASSFEFTDPYHQILLYSGSFCLIGLIGFIVGMASKERSIQMISSFFGLFGAVVPYIASWYKYANASDMVPPAFVFDFGDDGRLQTIAMLAAFAALIGFLLFLAAALIRFKKGKGTLVLRLIGLLLLLGVAASGIVHVFASGAPILDLFTKMDGIALLLKALAMVMFAASLLALTSVKEDAPEGEEPSAAKSCEEEPAEEKPAEEDPLPAEEDLPVGKEEFTSAPASNKE